jgi:hypothetical protein
LGGEGTEDDDFNSVHHGHGVRTHDIGVAPQYTQHFIVFRIFAQIFDPDVAITDCDVYFPIFGADLHYDEITPRISSSSMC